MTQEKGGRTLDEVEKNPNQGVALIGGHLTDVAWRVMSMQPEVRSGSGELGTLTSCRSNGEIQIHDGNNGCGEENSNKAESMEMNQMFMVVDLGGVKHQFQTAPSFELTRFNRSVRRLQTTRTNLR